MCDLSSPEVRLGARDTSIFLKVMAVVMPEGKYAVDCASKRTSGEQCCNRCKVLSLRGVRRLVKENWSALKLPI